MHPPTRSPFLLPVLQVLCGGENVYCSEVEAALAAHPAVLQAAVFGLPNALLGELVAAAVVLKPRGACCVVLCVMGFMWGGGSSYWCSRPGVHGMCVGGTAATAITTTGHNITLSAWLLLLPTPPTTAWLLLLLQMMVRPAQACCPALRTSSYNGAAHAWRTTRSRPRSRSWTPCPLR